MKLGEISAYLPDLRMGGWRLLAILSLAAAACRMHVHFSDKQEMLTDYPTLIRLMACEDINQDGICTDADKPLPNVEIDMTYIDHEGMKVQIDEPMVTDEYGYAETMTGPIWKFDQTFVYPHNDNGEATLCYDIKANEMNQDTDDNGEIITTIDGSIILMMCELSA